MLHDAVRFIQHVIRHCKDLTTLVDGKNMIGRLLLYLGKIRNLKGSGDEDVFKETAMAQVYLCLADLAR